MVPPPAILRFEHVYIAPSVQYESAIYDVSFELHSGEMMVLLLSEEHLLLPIADAAAGLVAPEEGKITCQGEDWTTMSAGRPQALRGRIGRIFPEGGWVNNLDIEENILLSQRHHTNRPTSDLFSEAAALARQFGLPGLPLGRPSHLRRQDLQKAACVRAFLGEPFLIIAEDPTRHVYADVIAPLVNRLFDARKRGAAVLWITSNPRIFADAGIGPTLRAKMAGAQIHFSNGGAR